MKEQIREILDNEELDNENKTTEIAKIIGQETVIKSKYNDKVAELRAKEAELSKVSEEYETLKTSSMTDTEKAQKAEQSLKEKERDFLIKSNKLDAERMFVGAGIGKEDYESILDDYVSEDATLTSKRISNVIDLLSKTKEVTKTEVTENIIKGTPKPNTSTSNPNPELTKDDFKKMSGFERAELYKTNKEVFDKLSN